MKVTKLQAAMIRKIALSEFTPMNGGEPETLADVGQVWTDCIIEDAEDKGVFTSLMNADLVNHSGRGRESTVGLTQAGFDAYKSLAAISA